MKNLLFLLLLFSSPVFGQSQFDEDSIRVHDLLGKGGEAARNSLYDSANYYYAEAEALSREMEYQHGIMSSVFGYGLVHHFKKEPKQALDYYLQAEDMIKHGIDSTHTDVERLFNNLGGVYIDLGYRLKARDYLLKTLELKEANNTSPISSAITHYNLGLIYLHFGENESALHNFMTAYPAYLDFYGENGARVAQLYTNIGIIHENLGNIEQAEQYYQRGIIIHLENHGPNYWNLAYPYSSMGSLYLKTDRPQQGLNYFLRSLKLCRENPQELIRLEALNEGALANYYLEQENYITSREHAEKAVDIMQQAYYDEHPRISEFYTTIGQTYVKERDFQQASYWFDLAQDLTIKGYGEIHPQNATLLLEQSKIYHEIQDYPKAMKTAQQALQALSVAFASMDPRTNPSANQVLSVNLLMNIVKHKGDIYKGHASQENRQENLLSAIDQYVAAVAIIDHMRRGYLSESAKLFLQNHAHEVYQRGIEVSYQLFSLNRSVDHLPKAFFFMEKSKASVLSEALQASTVTTIEGVDSKLLQQEIALDQQVKSLELKLADAQIDQSDSLTQKLTKELFNAKARVDSLVQVIHRSYPNYHQLKYNMKVLDFEQARGMVPDEGIAMSFFEADDSWYLLGFGANATFEKVPKSEISKNQIDAFRLEIADPETHLDSVMIHGYAIYQGLLAGTLQQHASCKQLIIIPDGILNYLPFDALTTANSRDNSLLSQPNYLLQDYSISYLKFLDFTSQP